MATEVTEQEKNEAKTNGQNGSSPNSLTETPPAAGKKSRFRLIAMALALLGVLIAVPLYFYYSVRESTDDAQVDGHIVPISPRINGTVISVEVNDNEVVQAGKVLVKLDPADYQVALARAEADLADAVAAAREAQVNVPLISINTHSEMRTTSAGVDEGRAGVLTAERQVEAANARLASSKARVSEAQANSVKAGKDLGRLKELVDKDEISKQQYDAAVASAEATKAQVETAQASVNEAAHNVDVAQSSLNQTKARLSSSEVLAAQSTSVRPQQQAASEARYKSALAKVQQRQAAVDQAKLNLDYTVIKAPVNGLVSRKVAEPGQILQPGQQLMAIVPLDDVWITANFKETQLKKMQIGQEVEIEVDAYGGRTYKGRIESIAAASGSRFSLLPPENATGNYVKVVQRVPVKILLDKGQDKEHLLRPGMSVVPTVHLK